MKTVLVTGANKGIGLAVVKHLAAKGCHVFLGARNASAGEEAAAAIVKNGGKVTPVLIDVADAKSVEAAAKEFAKSVGHLDVLINNAGIIVKGDASVFENSDELYRTTFETNTLGPLRVTRAFQALLERSAEPRVINVSSTGGQLADGADGWAPAYCISKTALNGVTSQMATALKKFAVNSVCPGWVRTDMGGSGAPLSVDEGADTIVWLALEAPQTLTGQFMKKRAVLPW